MSKASEVYTQLLLPKGHGCPIWCPEPAESLPPMYREGSVRIGHVGRIIPGGPLFNICTGADEPINCDGVLEGFEKFVLGPQDVTILSTYHNCRSHICRKRLEKRLIDTDPISG